MLSPFGEEVVRRFFTQREHFEVFLSSVERQSLEEALVELINLYARDKNSSTLREFITLVIAGYQRSGDKLGFEGRREEDGDIVYAEVKPKNLERARSDRFNGGGNFTDFRQERLDKYLATRLQMLVSGFLDGELVHVLKFPFNCPQFVERLQTRIDRWLQGRQRRPGEFLRSLEFDWRHFNNCNVRPHFLNQTIIDNEINRFDGSFRTWLRELAGMG